MKKVEFNLPVPITLGSQYKFRRSEIDYEMARLVAIAMGQRPPAYEKPDDDYLIGSADVAKKFNISGRTLTRRIKELEARKPEMLAAGSSIAELVSTERIA